MGKYAEYMILGYSAMGILMAGIVLGMVWRYRMLGRELRMLDQLEAEDQGAAGSEINIRSEP